MSGLFRVLWAGLLFASTSVYAQTQIKGRALVTVDTSGSMVWHFGDCSTTGGDSGNPALYCDNNIGTGFTCSSNAACTAANGALNLFPTTTNNPSRLYAAKAAMQDVINSASGSIDFGLSRYALSSASDGFACPNNTSCCAPSADGTTRGRCVPQALNDYPDVPNSINCLGTLNSHCNLTAISGCGTSLNCSGAACAATEGGQILVQPAANSSTLLTPWIDFTEDFCNNGSGLPRNPELRAAGATPLAGSIRTARKQWYQPIYNVSEVGAPGYNPSSPIYDAQIDCRSYVNVVITDGVESCENSSGLFSDPTTAVSELTAINPKNPVKTYVIGVAFVQNESCNGSPADGTICPKTGPGGGCSVVNGQSVCSCNIDNDCGTSCEANSALGGAKVHYVCGADHVCHHPGLAALNAMAAAGGTGTARFASNQVDIEAAFADIVASTVKVEKCNNADDDCNNACDEPFPDVAVTGASCTNKHAANTCNNGQPQGTHCYATGVYVCSADQLGESCNAPTCATNPALCPTSETAGGCNGLDDDCNGVVDDCTPFVANSCCNKCPACNTSGKPQPETCNGCDDDCDGTVDNHLTDTGFGCGSNIGLCEPGTTACCSEANPSTGSCTTSQTSPQSSNPDRLVCLGGRSPSTELCDGADNDCNGVTDEVSRTCYSGPSGTAGVGRCKSGTQQCTGTSCGTSPNACCPTPISAGKACPGPATYGACVGEVDPTAELCNGIDDNCNGQTDENVTDSWAGTACCSTGNNADCTNTGTGSRCKLGTSQCVSASRQCVGSVAKSVEICNGIDDDCNGIIDDVAGIGTACTGNGTNTTGACTATFVCNPASPGTGPNGLTCTQKQGPVAETCNGIDDNCDGTIDNNLTDVGTTCGDKCPGGLVANCVGQCKAGVVACQNGVRVCQGNVGPSPEVCDSIDNNCDGSIDNNVTDSWAGQDCCSTGNNADCTNTGTGTRCGLGKYSCLLGQRVCTGSVAKSNEVCDTIDNDCNGVINDVPGVGTSCSSGGVNTTGICTAQWACGASPGPGPGGLTCTQQQAPRAETCNGLDDNCNGTVDDSPSGVGVACGQNCPGGQVANCVGACKAGATACINGTLVCSGSTGPTAEVCNGIDDNCNGQTDENLTDSWLNQACCSTGNLTDCQNTATGTRCATGLYQCQAGARVCAGSVAKSNETCDKVDNDCNGAIDDVSGLGTACSGGGTNTKGVCTAAWACGATAGPGPNGLTCTQVKAPGAETCNGLDDDCNGNVDDNLTDTGGACGVNCPGGQVANCIGACKAGTVQCVGGAPVCSGSTGPTNETCNTVDDDCNGQVDDVPGIGTACTATNIKTLGICTASYQCTGSAGPGPNGLTCTQIVGPAAETCNGADDDCNGKIDDNLTDVGGPCGQNCPGGLVANCVGACKAGTFVCQNGARLCSGSTGPAPELCNLIDDDCNGKPDDNLSDGWEGQTCCPTGNPADCANTGGSTRCMLGTYQCQAGGRVCAGGVAQSPEVCDGIDNDCNGIVDDVPGLGSACSDNGVLVKGPCTAKYTCNGNFNPNGPNGLTCTQDVGPSPELCNGIDDDCNGTIDDNLADPRVNVVGGAPCVALQPLPGTSFPASGATPPCDPGTTQCKNGQVVCVGEVQPVPDQCGSVPTDCTGNPNANGNCPTGFKCVQGACNPTCVGGEFDTCPGGSRCDTTQGVCVPDACKMLNCAAMSFNCELNATTGMYECVDPCSRVTCAPGQICKAESGGCIYNDCRGLGCPQKNQTCMGNPPMCITDLCKNLDGSPIVCPTGEFCDPSTGMCKNPCQCTPDQKCVNGECVADPCKGVSCPGGQVCAIVGGVGTCVENQCQQGCNPGTVCCSGMCVSDPCATFVCPGDSKCQADDSCQPTCAAGPKDEIAATGGGGANGACSVGGASAESGRGVWLLLAVVIASVLVRRKRLLAMSALLAVAFFGAGCRTDNYCLNCNKADGFALDLAGEPDLATDMAMPDLIVPPDFTPPPDLFQGVDGCSPTNQGIEICDGIDNDCNGKIDDVDPSRLTNDPNNCGKCGTVCEYNSLHQQGLCTTQNGGTPTCMPGPCILGFVDNDPAVPGCEYQCTPTTDKTEICDGKDNDCDGTIDNGFGYPSYASDTNNCGTCGKVCSLPGAVATCVADLATGRGICAVDHCINDGKDTYRIKNYQPGVLNTTGCDYHCAVPSTTTTTGSEDCNSVACSFPTEVCNGVDDDCNFLTDDAPTDVGQVCGQNCPGGDPARCVGNCKAGVLACVAGVRVCQGSTGPTLETCEGTDQDCDGTPDDNLSDAWIGSACCPTGNVADCLNTTTNGMTGTRCGTGAYACVNGGRQCQGGTPKAVEVCNGIDDDCNGIVDDVPGIGTACSGVDGVNTTGACTAVYACTGTFNNNNPVGLTCTQKVGPKAFETCNGIDDNCNGTVDDNPTDVGGSCGQNCPGGLVANCRGACQAGTVQCQGGAKVCVGSTGPKGETCNGTDDDCNGSVDDVPGIGSSCTGPGIKTGGVCTASYVCNPASPGTGPNGLTCQQGNAGSSETCNGLDDNCDGTTDNNPTDVGGQCADACPGGLLANCVGICKAGTLVCSNGARSCSGSVGPQPETCNGVDDDCSGVKDDHLTDPWLNTACCPTGNLADCQNSGAGTRCGFGAFVCQNGAKTCSGGTAKGVEVCNGIDDDCNGIVDDVPGVGTACNVGGVNTTGACRANWACNGTFNATGLNGMTCTQTVAPQAETCNGIDDNCNGTVDDSPAGVGVACGQNCPGGNVANCRGACKSGTTACTNGTLVCNGSTGPSPESCNNVDDDCNGTVDDNLTDTWVGGNCCPGGNLTDCQNTGTGTRCAIGKYACVSGAQQCQGGVAKSTEICDNVDNDCNGPVDDVAGVGQPCTGTGIQTGGICTATWSCNGGVTGTGPNGLTCRQVQGPRAETCNGLDDNCNGTIDDNPSGVGVTCGSACPGGQVANCIGECKAGTTVCSGGVLSCSGSTGPSAEICDAKDNDCNGTIDDGFGYPNYNSDPKNCGACGTVCGLPNAVNGCHTDASIDATGKGVCYVVACNADSTQGYSYVPSTCGGSTPRRDGPGGVGCNYKCPVWPTTTEVCDGKDNDCNGAVDELKTACYTNGLVAPSGLCATQGVCSGQTIPVQCTGAGGWKCNYSSVPFISLDGNGNLTTTEPYCDSRDNNCNGVADLDGFPTKGQACTAGLGVCQNSGTIVCTSNTTSGCSATASPGRATNELCDGKDNDCNGLVDESTDYTDPTSGVTYKGWRDPMVAVPKLTGVGNYYVYAYEATRPDATATSSGGSTARACSNSGVKPWGNVTLAQAQAACAAVRDSKGQPLRLCTQPEWQKACEGPTGPAAAKWSMSKNPQAYVANICNDLNENLGTSWATGSNGSKSVSLSEFCYVDWSTAGQIHDMSGNLAEWTSTAVVNGSTTYYKIRGGAYDSPQGGTTCEFDFDIAQPSFANADVGFRCCSDNPSCGDTSSDPSNCGACGTVCPSPQVCSNSACAASCGAGLTNCSRACVNTQTDFANCGGCGVICPNGQICSAGKCGCASGATLCNGSCVNTQTDPGNCGSCSNVCGSGQFCSSGICTSGCGTGLTACGASCVNEQTDANNCGGCGVKCGTGIQCVSGACCTGTVCSGACVNTLSDNNNCGGCGTICSGGATCQNGKCCGVGLTNCGGVCVNLATDTNNCNACGNACPAGNSCNNGSCCGTGLLQCANQCVNPLTDNNNCGDCFIACGAGTSCSNGACCTTGFTGCSGSCVNTKTDPNNCGGCGVVCGGGSSCINGACSCSTYSSYCGGKCIPTAQDPLNCGGCGIVCSGATPLCQNSKCVGACSNVANKITSCSNSCGIDLTSDRNNCGTCGTTCTSAQGCVSSACQTAVVPFQPLTAVGQLCNSNNGFGPVITLTTSGAPYTGSCSGDLAATTFTFGICACQTYNGGGSQTIYGWDSTQGPFVTSAPGDLGGSVGVNASFTNSSTFTLTGDMWAASSLNLGNTTIYERLHVQSMAGGNYTVGGSAEVASWPATSAGTTGSAITGVPVAPDRNLYSPVKPLPGGNTWSENGGSLIQQAVTIQQPCKRCASGQLVPIAGYVTNYSGTNNNNALIGLNANAFVNFQTDTVVDLPCGYYYLNGITSNKNVSATIVAHGNTALFIGGNIDVAGPLTITLSPGARLDVFVSGYVNEGGSGMRLGNINTPANLRIYVAGASGSTAMTFGNPGIVSCDVYTPGGAFSPTSAFTLYGALFTQDYLQGSGSMTVFYDRASATENSVCPPPTGNGCTSCLDCSNQACNIPSGQSSGTCGGCTNDGQCCAPLRCVGGTCQFTSF